MIVKCDDFGCEFENFIYRIFEFPGKKIVALLVKSILLLYIYMNIDSYLKGCTFF